MPIYDVVFSARKLLEANISDRKCMDNKTIYFTFDVNISKAK